MAYTTLVPVLSWIVLAGVFADNTSPASGINDEGNITNCYAEAVYDELIKIIDFVKARTYRENDVIDRRASQAIYPKKFQEDEDYGTEQVAGGGGPFEVPSIVPQIFKLVGSAIALNSSGLTEGSFGLLPERVSTQITSVLGSLASSILGPGVVPTPTTRAPFRRRRRTTTTTTVEPSTTENITETTVADNLNATTEADLMTIDFELSLNETSDSETMNDTETSTASEPTTTDVLFKESSLGELPVYAAAYAPNYVATTTFPVYANNFLHSLYPAPTTTTTTTTTTTEATTSTDPNSYAIPLPFDYMEGGIGGIGPLETGNLTDMTFPPLNFSSTQQPIQQTPPEYGEYEYEEQTEEAKGEEVSRSRDSLYSSLF